MSTKDYFEKDYYKILGVTKDAKPADIKKAFRKIARDNHPDAHPGDKLAEQRFKEASEANDILSDPDKRKEYDETRRLMGSGFRFPGAGGPTAGRTSQAGGFGSFSDLFGGSNPDNISDLLGGLFGGGSNARFGRQAPNRARRGADVEGEVTIDFMRAANGATVSVQMTSDAPCSACRGTGAQSGTVPRVCPTCQGSGVRPGGGLAGLTEPCQACRGRGLVVDDPCPVCHGSGRAPSMKTMQVRIPAGVDDGQRIRIAGKGGPGEHGGQAGDLYVTVHVTPHTIFGRKGHNLTIDLPVTYTEATLGAEVEVPTLGGMPVRLRIPPGTPSGRTFRVRGKGVVDSKGVYGDLLATVQVVVPSVLTPSAKAALQDFRDAAAEADPRAELLRKAKL
ncbi:MAG: molecular chaperone DnaJ [Propionibacteriaceae bacterium]|nr:molecular chaperone DnaJ [Propionibacteriaceae bacterium]